MKLYADFYVEYVVCFQIDFSLKCFNILISNIMSDNGKTLNIVINKCLNISKWLLRHLSCSQTKKLNTKEWTAKLKSLDNEKRKRTNNFEKLKDIICKKVSHHNNINKKNEVECESHIVDIFVFGFIYELDIKFPSVNRKHLNSENFRSSLIFYIIHY